MLQEAIDLQQRAVRELEHLVKSKKEITFRSPTGSGKTHMMADFMNRVLADDQQVIFLVSTLSKGNLAQQNYDVFRDCADRGVFPKLNPYLISTDTSGEERLFIPTEYNIYVLPRDLYKKGGRLMQGAMEDFLQNITSNLFRSGLNKKIYVIKDECHQATNNLDTLSDSYFTKVINFSATPKLSRGQKPDVEITDYEAEQAKLIKRIEFGSEEDKLDKAIAKLKEIQADYINLLGVNPCLIIQISNKDKADAELAKIEAELQKTDNQNLKWMLIVDKDKDCKTNDKVGKLPVARWKDYAKERASTIDVIIFKMVISEGWDIPRACMLYQMRDSQSDQLNEQVMGRVRRNPRLIDFENLSPEAQTLATTAWIWGNPPLERKKSIRVKLYSEQDIVENLKVTTTRLKSPSEQKADFNVAAFLQQQRMPPARKDIFTLYQILKKSNTEIQTMCYDYAENDVQKWLKFNEFNKEIKSRHDEISRSYDKSMEKHKEVSFPVVSDYTDNGNYANIGDWVWQLRQSDRFAFDSEAERE